MAQSCAVLDQRRSPRAQLNLPVRLRWQEPLRHFVEVTQTLDVSRTGLLVHRLEPCALHTRVWVTYPFSPDSPESQPETPARVVRVKTTPTGRQLVAIGFEPQRRIPPSVGKFNRRAAERTPMALPLRVRLAGAPWPEEVMTVDISEGGVMFRSARQYALGEVVKFRLPHGRWASFAEVSARVVRLEPIPGSVDQRVALAVVPPA